MSASNNINKSVKSSNIVEVQLKEGSPFTRRIDSSLGITLLECDSHESLKDAFVNARKDKIFREGLFMLLGNDPYLTLHNMISSLSPGEKVGYNGSATKPDYAFLKVVCYELAYDIIQDLDESDEFIAASLMAIKDSLSELKQVSFTGLCYLLRFLIFYGSGECDATAFPKPYQKEMCKKVLENRGNVPVYYAKHFSNDGVTEVSRGKEASIRYVSYSHSTSPESRILMIESESPLTSDDLELLGVNATYKDKGAVRMKTYSEDGNPIHIYQLHAIAANIAGKFKRSIPNLSIESNGFISLAGESCSTKEVDMPIDLHIFLDHLWKYISKSLVNMCDSKAKYDIGSLQTTVRHTNYRCLFKCNDEQMRLLINMLFLAECASYALIPSSVISFYREKKGVKGELFDFDSSICYIAHLSSLFANCPSNALIQSKYELIYSLHVWDHQVLKKMLHTTIKGTKAGVIYHEERVPTNGNFFFSKLPSKWTHVVKGSTKVNEKKKKNKPKPKKKRKARFSLKQLASPVPSVQSSRRNSNASSVSSVNESYSFEALKATPYVVYGLTNKQEISDAIESPHCLIFDGDRGESVPFLDHYDFNGHMLILKTGSELLSKINAPVLHMNDYVCVKITFSVAALLLNLTPYKKVEFDEVEEEKSSGVTLFNYLKDELEVNTDDIPLVIGEFVSLYYPQETKDFAVLTLDEISEDTPSLITKLRLITKDYENDE
jgi:hypothetical protein